MSPNQEQLEGTRRELARNLELCRRTPAEVALDLDWSAERFDRTLAIADGSDPTDVWLLRDALERAVRTTGETPERYTVLTDDLRGSADRWFGLPKRRP